MDNDVITYYTLEDAKEIFENIKKYLITNSLTS